MDLHASLRLAGLTLAALWAFWLLYVFTMGLYRASLSKRLRGLPLLMAAPVLVAAFLVDFVMQMTVFSAVFLEFPPLRGYRFLSVRENVKLPELLVTQRLRRYMRDLPPHHWRRRWADKLCHHLLDPYDPTGSHCDSDVPVLKA